MVTPVQTVGNVVFAYHKTRDDGFIKFEYNKTEIKAPYAPKDGDQPLRYVLRFLLNLYNEEKNVSYSNIKRNYLSLKKIYLKEKMNLMNLKRRLIKERKHI